MTNNNSNGNGGSNAAASGWLGFSLSPHMDEHNHVQQQQQQQHQGLFYPSSVAAAYSLGGDVATGGYYSQLASMPLKSDGSLCIMEALRRTDQQDHHGTYFTGNIHAYFLRRPRSAISFLEFMV